MGDPSRLGGGFGAGLREGHVPSQSRLASICRLGRPDAATRALAVSLIAASVGLLAPANPAAAQTCTAICLAVDGSGSIVGSDFSLMKQGLSAAVRDASVVPHDGKVHLTVVQFAGSSAQVEVAPTLIADDATATTVADKIDGISQLGGGTPFAAAIDLCKTSMASACPGGRQVINIVTDGQPEGQAAADAAVASRDAAVAAGIDQVNAEAVSAPDAGVTFLRDRLVYPPPGYLAPPFSGGGGFVIKIAGFQDFAPAIRAKIGQIIAQPTPGTTPGPGQCASPGQTVPLNLSFMNTGTTTENVVNTVTLPSGLSAIPGTCTSVPPAGGDPCTCNIVNPSTVTCTGTSVGGHTMPFSFSTMVANNAPPATQLTFTLNSVLGTNPPKVAQGSITTCASAGTPGPTHASTPGPGGGCVTYPSSDVVNKIIPEVGSVTSTLTLPAGPIGKLSVVGLRGTHSYDGDLIFKLKGPDGTTITLLQQHCGDADNFNLALDDSAPASSSLEMECDDAKINDGLPHVPKQALAAFAGKDGGGTWMLQIDDPRDGDGGALLGWGLQNCPPTPSGCQIYNASGSQVGQTIPEVGSISSTLSVPSGVIGTLSVVGLRGTHTYDGDLIFKLKGPDGTTITLLQQHCGDADNFNLTLDDSAPPASSLEMDCDDAKINDGLPHVPKQALAAFAGKDAGGTWTLQIDDPRDGDGGSLQAWGLQICPPTPSGCQTYNASGPQVPQTIPEVGTVVSTLTIPSGTVGKLSVIGLRGTHTYDGDLIFTLKGPDGTTVTLLQQHCGDADNFNLTLDDSAPPSSSLEMDCDDAKINDGLAHVPHQPLSAFDGKSAGGTWTLQIDDPREGDGGSLQGWGLQICPSAPSGCTIYNAAAPQIPQTIPEVGSINSTLTVPSGTVGTVSVVGLHGTHTYDGDLIFTLQGPDSTTVTLLQQNCGDADNFNLGLDDSAPPSSSLQMECDDAKINDGLPHVPQQPLAAFIGKSAGGTWTLHIDDPRDGDGGSLQGWGLQICEPGGKPTATPTVMVPCNLNYGVPNAGQSFFVTNTGMITGVLNSSVALPPGVTAIAGSCTTDIGTCTVTNPSLVSWSGTLTPGQVAHYAFSVLIADSIPPGTRVCGTLSTQFDGLQPTTQEVCGVTCPKFMTPSATVPPTATRTPTATHTRTSTPTATHTFTATRTHTPTHTFSPTSTFTHTHTPTHTFTPSVTPTASRTVTGTHPPTFTFTATHTVTLTPTQTATFTATHTATHTFTPTATHTPTHTATFSPTATMMPTTPRGKPTFTATPTPPPTATPTPTHTATRTPSSTLTATATTTPTGSRSPTGTATTTATVTQSASPKATSTSTASPSTTSSLPPTPSRTATTSVTATATGMATVTAKPSSTATATVMATSTAATPGATATVGTPGASVTATRIRTPKYTFTSTPSPAATETPTAGTPRPTGSQPSTTTTPTAGTPAATGSQPSTTTTPTAGTPAATGSRPPTSMTPTSSPGTPTVTGSRPPTSATATAGTPTVTGSQPPTSGTPTGTRGTPTATSSPKETFTPTPTGSLPPTTPGTPGACGRCVGDCNCNGEVTIDELIVMVNIALDDNGTARCLAGDPSGDGHITVDEIIQGVVNALVGCPTPGPVTSATFTPTPTPTIPGNQTPGTGTVPQRAAGATVRLSQGLRALPLVLSSIAQLAGGGGSVAGLGDGSAAAVQNCSGGGTRDFSCTQTLPTVPPRNYMLMFNGCVLNTASGGSVALQNTITAQSTETGPLAICSFPPTALSALALTNVSVVAKNAAAVTTLSATFNLTGSLSVTPDLLSACKVSAFTMTLNGTIDVQSGSLSELLTFNNTSVKLDITQFSSSCVPVVYRMTVNGDASFSSPSLGSALSGTFTNFVFSDNTTSGSDLVMIDGQVNSACLGTGATFSTPMALSLAPGMVCPSAGAVLVTVAGSTDRLNYTPTGGVDIDLGNNASIDQMIASCLDPQLYMCP